jgi:hypothetical protein
MLRPTQTPKTDNKLSSTAESLISIALRRRPVTNGKLSPGEEQHNEPGASKRATSPDLIPIQVKGVSQTDRQLQFRSPIHHPTPVSAKSGVAAAPKKPPFGCTQIAGLGPSGSFVGSSATSPIELTMVTSFATSTSRKRKRKGEGKGDLRGGKCGGDTCAGVDINTQQPESESKAKLEARSKMMNPEVRMRSSFDNALTQMESNADQNLALTRRRGDRILDEEILITHLHANFLSIKTAKARITLLKALRQLNLFKALLVENYGQAAQDLINRSSDGESRPARRRQANMNGCIRSARAARAQRSGVS